MTLKRISPAWNYTFQIPNEESVMELMYAHLLLGAVAPVRPAIEAPMRATDATKRKICSMEKADDENKAVKRTRWAEDDNKAEEPKKAEEEKTADEESAVFFSAEEDNKADEDKTVDEESAVFFSAEEEKTADEEKKAEEDKTAEEPKKAKEEQTDEDKSSVMNGMMIDLMDDTDFM